MVERRKLESAALFLPVFGALLIMPPLVLPFVVRASVFGIPVAVVYLFVVWLLLVFGAMALSRAMPRDPMADHDGDETGGG